LYVGETTRYGISGSTADGVVGNPSAVFSLHHLMQYPGDPIGSMCLCVGETTRYGISGSANIDKTCNPHSVLGNLKGGMWEYRMDKKLYDR
jgi:hypothetical protein